MPYRYADIIIPLNFRDYVTYSIPDELMGKVVPGSIVNVNLAQVSCNGVVVRLTDRPSFSDGKIRAIKEIVNLPPISEKNLAFLQAVSDYYCCSPSDVFRFAAPSTTKVLKKKQAGGTEQLPSVDEITVPTLTNSQQVALAQICENMRVGKTTLLKGVSGSGKTEVYINIALAQLRKGCTTLLLVPEQAMCRQMQMRLKKIFGARLLVFHSGKTPADRRAVYQCVAKSDEPYVVLGLRSALFLPFDKRLGVIIVDEEHDSSYKQNEPAPRYHGRDTALMLGRAIGAPVLLGSSTPSFETIYNVRSGKYVQVNLEEKYFGEGNCEICIIDMAAERRKNAVRGTLSLPLIKAIGETLELGRQCLVFSSRSAETMQIAEDILLHFPEAAIERVDADAVKDKKELDAIIDRFKKGSADILVGSQMIAKGFDFDNIGLAAVIKAETLSSASDFRADERTLHLLLQFKGRAEHRPVQSRMYVQTLRASHPIFQALRNNLSENTYETLLCERYDMEFPPYVRLIKITLRSASEEHLQRLSDEVLSAINKVGINSFSGPAAPPSAHSDDKDKSVQFLIKLPRSASSAALKKNLYKIIRYIPRKHCIIDVDPV